MKKNHGTHGKHGKIYHRIERIKTKRMTPCGVDEKKQTVIITNYETKFGVANSELRKNNHGKHEKHGREYITE